MKNILLGILYGVLILHGVVGGILAGRLLYVVVQMWWEGKL